MKRKFSSALACLIALILFAYATPLTAQAAMDGSPTGNIVTSWTGTPGDLYRYHTHTKGTGIPIIIMPVHFGSGDLAAGGKLQTASTWAADLILDSEQYLFDGLADYLDIYVYIQSEAVHPVPQNGYVNSYQDKFNIMHNLAENTIGGQGVGFKVRMVYLGNSDNAGQVGGHALMGIGALLSWGNQPGTSDPWEPTPSYWTLHEFIGHGFAALADEYVDSNHTGSGAVSPNLYVSSSAPTNSLVQWRDFIGFEESGHKHGIYRRGGSNRYHPTNDSFMNTNPSFYVPMYHKWVIYQKTMEYAGTPKTLADFCTFMQITLPGGTGGGDGDFGPNPPTGIPNVTGAAAAMSVFLVLSAALWGYIILRRRAKNG